MCWLLPRLWLAVPWVSDYSFHPGVLATSAESARAPVEVVAGSPLLVLSRDIDVDIDIRDYRELLDMGMRYGHLL